MIHRSRECSYTPLNLNTLFMLLPRELKAEIFLHSLSNQRPPIIGHSCPSSVLLQVCKDWRNIALSTPRLWNCFQVVFDDATDVRHTTSDQFLSTVALWVSRSADTSLSATLVYIPPPSATQGRFNATVQAVLALLLKCSHRWECIRLIVPGMTLSPFIESAPHGMGRLQSLALDLQGRWCASPFKVQNLGFDWSQLTELNLSLETGSILTLDECWDILSQASSLVECSMNAQCIFHQRTDEDVLPLALHRFYLTLQGKTTTGQATSLVAFLQSLNLPLLSDLRLRWLVREAVVWEESQSAFVAFLTSLLPSLEVLHLAYLPVSEEQLLQLLRCVPFLHHLILQFSMSSDRIGPRFFEAFKSSDDPFLPHLRRLHIESSGVSWSSQAISALDSRLRTGLQFSTYISEKAANSLSDVFEKWQGLDVHMRYIMIR